MSKMYNIVAVVAPGISQASNVGTAVALLAQLPTNGAGLRVRVRKSTQKAGAVTIRVRDKHLAAAKAALSNANFPLRG